MISKFTTEIPCQLETLMRWKLNFAVQTADDSLSKLRNSNGEIEAIFTPESPRHTTNAKLKLEHGTPPVTDIQIDMLTVDQELGAAIPGNPYKQLGSIVVSGVDTSGRAWSGRSTGKAGDTSLAFEMATSDKPNEHAQAAELKKW